MKRVWASRLRSAPQRNVATQISRRVGARHEIPMCEPDETNTKTSQDHLSVSGLYWGGAPSFDGGNQGQLIASNKPGVPAGLPRLTDCTGDRRIEVLNPSR